METTKQKKGIHSFLTSKKYQDLKKSLDVPKETDKNHVLVGSDGLDYSYAVYNPHNARFYFNFNSKTLNHRVKGMVLKSINSTEKCLKNFNGCRVVVKKTQIEITNKINSERRFMISGSADLRSEQIKKADAILECEAIAVLHAFVDIFGGVTDFKCINSSIADNKILHDRIVDSLPVKMRFRNDVVKKVYNDVPVNVEFSDPAFASNYFRNSGLNDFSPIIAKELNNLSASVDRLNTLSWLKNNCRSIDDVLCHKDKVALLSVDEKKIFSDWSFEGLRL